jgi:hypothetical protein
MEISLSGVRRILEEYEAKVQRESNFLQEWG